MEGIVNQISISSIQLKNGNYPRIFHHGKKTKDVIILTHGLSDSPHYVEAIGKRFFNEGLNVILPLLPAHGLKDPNKAMEDRKLDFKWRAEIDAMVKIASSLGDRISLGGFSTGGALSYNKILREEAKIRGGLFLFSGAIDVSFIDDVNNSFLARLAIKISDGDIIGIGKDPYKYPTFPKYGGLELGDIIDENKRLSKNRKINQAVFAAHSVHDETANLSGISKLLEKHVHRGLAFVISENVTHSELPLDKTIELDNSQKLGPETPPKANPKFRLMMDSAMQFFNNEVRGDRG
jgi:esterase/lipase